MNNATTFILEQFSNQFLSVMIYQTITFRGFWDVIRGKPITFLGLEKNDPRESTLGAAFHKLFRDDWNDSH